MHIFLKIVSSSVGNYWIDPNVGSTSDAIQVYCKRPGCSCIDYDLPDKTEPIQWWDAGDKPFSQLSEGFDVSNSSYDTEQRELRGRKQCCIYCNEYILPP